MKRSVGGSTPAKAREVENTSQVDTTAALTTCKHARGKQNGKRGRTVSMYRSHRGMKTQPHIFWSVASPAHNAWYAHTSLPSCLLATPKKPCAAALFQLLQPWSIV
eukprot:m.585591 g.585591  ORF g.585591 m.585591 type:complete len:106 (+) comp57970_c0_seq37:720-1037(+)